MDWDNSFGFRGDGGFNKGGIYIVGLFININKDRCGSAETDRLGSGNKGAWGGISIDTNLGGKAAIKFSDISYAGTAIYVSCCWNGGPVEISDSIFTNNYIALGGYAGW